MVQLVQTVEKQILSLLQMTLFFIFPDCIFFFLTSEDFFYGLYLTCGILSSLIGSQFIAGDRCIGNLIVNGGCFYEHGMFIKWCVP